MAGSMETRAQLKVSAYVEMVDIVGGLEELVSLLRYSVVEDG